jgi:hypothetical protein
MSAASPHHRTHTRAPAHARPRPRPRPRASPCDLGVRPGPRTKQTAGRRETQTRSRPQDDCLRTRAGQKDLAHGLVFGLALHDTDRGRHRPQIDGPKLPSERECMRARASVARGTDKRKAVRVEGGRRAETARRRVAAPTVVPASRLERPRGAARWRASPRSPRCRRAQTRMGGA